MGRLSQQSASLPRENLIMPWISWKISWKNHKQMKINYSDKKFRRGLSILISICILIKYRTYWKNGHYLTLRCMKSSLESSSFSIISTILTLKRDRWLKDYQIILSSMHFWIQNRHS